MVWRFTILAVPLTALVVAPASANPVNAVKADFSHRPGSAAIDKAAVIPNVTDGYTGAAPDLGALEYGKPAPHYGPGS